MNDATYWNALSRDLTNDPDKLRRDFMQQMKAAALGPSADPLPWEGFDEDGEDNENDLANVAAEDQPWPVVASLCDDIPLDPYRQLSGDEE